MVVLGAGVFFRTMRTVREIGRSGTYERVRSVLVRRLGVSPETVRPGASLGEDLRPGRIDRLELDIALEEEFQVDIPDGEASAYETVTDIVDGVDRALQAQQR